MNSNPIFSVIIPTCNRIKLLDKCLKCFEPGSQSLAKEKYEVIVTDDSQQVDSMEMISASYLWVDWQPGAHNGPATNRNHGAKNAKGEWLIFCDDDCFADSQMLEAYLKAIESNPDCQVFEGRIYADRPRRSIAETGPWNEQGGFLWSGNFAITNNICCSLGGFDERFLYASMEDVDLRLRLKNSGYDFIFVSSASVVHSWKIRKNNQQLKQHRVSVLTYLSIHSEELRRINSFYYLYLIFRNLFKVTIPNLAKFGFCGAKYEFFEHLSDFKMAFLLINFSIVEKVYR
ncbi:MAG: glycosyltransferase [Candidatus Omnitrophica bacterium]|nr:glycosyltransferase [Candidatus Omnitrophota bacterium]